MRTFYFFISTFMEDKPFEMTVLKLSENRISKKVFVWSKSVLRGLQSLCRNNLTWFDIVKRDSVKAKNNIHSDEAQLRWRTGTRPLALKLAHLKTASLKLNCANEKNESHFLLFCPII